MRMALSTLTYNSEAGYVNPENHRSSRAVILTGMFPDAASLVVFLRPSHAPSRTFHAPLGLLWSRGSFPAHRPCYFMRRQPLPSHGSGIPEERSCFLRWVLLQ